MEREEENKSEGSRGGEEDWEEKQMCKDDGGKKEADGGIGQGLVEVGDERRGRNGWNE